MLLELKLKKSFFKFKKFYNNPSMVSSSYERNKKDFSIQKDKIAYSKKSLRKNKWCINKNVVIKKNEKYLGIVSTTVDIEDKTFMLLGEGYGVANVIFQNTFKNIKNNDFLDFIFYMYLKKNKKDFKEIIENNHNIINLLEKEINDFEFLLEKENRISETFIRDEILKFKNNSESFVNLMEFIKFYNWIVLNNIKHLFRSDENEVCYLSFDYEGMRYDFEFSGKDDDIKIKRLMIKDTKIKGKFPEELITGNYLLDILRQNLKKEFSLSRVGEINKFYISIPNWLLKTIGYKNNAPYLTVQGIKSNGFIEFVKENDVFSVKINEDKDGEHQEELKEVNKIIKKCNKDVSTAEHLGLIYAYIYKKDELKDIIKNFIENKEEIEKDHLFDMLDLTVPFYSTVISELYALEKELIKIKNIKKLEDLIESFFNY